MTERIRLDNQTVDGTLTPAKISTNPLDNFTFPGNVTITGSVSAASGTGGGEAGSNFLGIWSATGSLNRLRRYHSTVLLQNGKVLVAGGQDGITTSTTNTCEIYDPATGLWTLTGSMTDARRLVKAVLLQSGKVLIIGQDIYPASPNCELYDPMTGTWASTGSMNTARVRSSAILLPNGKVLVAGGSPDFTVATVSCELYDPNTETWSPTGDLNVARTSGWIMNYLTLLQDGRVLVAGGEDAYNGNTLTSTEFYDPGNETWAVTGSMSASRGDHGLVTLQDGRVLAYGGQAAPGYASVMTCELFAPSTISYGTDTWTTVGNLGIEKIDAPAVLLPNGIVLAVGGVNAGSGAAHRACELFTHLTNLDPGDVWSRTSDLAYQRSSEQAILLQDGRVLVAGGDPVGGQGVASCEIYSAVSNGPFLPTKMTTAQRDSLTQPDTWEHVTGIPGAPYSIVLNSVIGLPTGEFLSVGTRAGQGDFTLETSCSLYSPTAHTWTLTGSLNTARDGSGLCILTTGPQSGKVLTVGGDSVGTSCELFDRSSATWTTTGSLNSAHGGQHGTVIQLLSNGKVLAVGDDNGCELFDPNTLTWSATASCSHGTGNHNLVLLPNENVLAVGADGLAQIFDMGNETWSDTGSLGYDPVALHLLYSGKVLAYGGTSSSLYDPIAGTWAASGTLNASRSNVTSTSSILPTGKVIVAWPSTDVELYDPATGAWTLTTSVSGWAGIYGDNYGNPIATNYVSGLTVLVSNYPSLTAEFTQHLPTTELVIYNTDIKKFQYYNGMTWDTIATQSVFTEVLTGDISVTTPGVYYADCGAAPGNTINVTLPLAGTVPGQTFAFAYSTNAGTTNFTCSGSDILRGGNGVDGNSSTSSGNLPDATARFTSAGPGIWIVA